jgi:hypothetical protein
MISTSVVNEPCSLKRLKLFLDQNFPSSAFKTVYSPFEDKEVLSATGLCRLQYKPLDKESI